MSLYKVADGILDTHVTWKDVEEELQKSFQTDAIFGNKKSVKNISDQKGYMSKIALIQPDWHDVDNGNSLPERIAVKISSQLPFIEFSKELKYTDDNGYEDQKLKFLGKILREAHNREVEAYKLLERFNHPDVPVTKGYIIMEYIPDIHSTSMSESISADDLIPTVRGVATFAALGHALSDKDKEFALGAEFLEYYFNTFLGSASIESTLQNLKNTFTYVEESKVEQLMKIYRHYLKIVNRYTKISESLGFEMIFNHGDLWQSNMLYGTEANGELKLKAIIDWQAVSLLPPGFDMTRLFIGSLSIEDRRHRSSELLKIYHETFSSVLGKELFSFQQIFDSYNLHFPLMSLMVLPGMARFSDNSAVRRNMEAIIEDVFETHEYNGKYFTDFIKL